MLVGPGNVIRARSRYSNVLADENLAQSFDPLWSVNGLSFNGRSAMVAPDGISLAGSISEGGSTGPHIMTQGPFADFGAGAYWMTAYVKRDFGSRDFMLKIKNFGSPDVGAQAYFNLSLGTAYGLTNIGAGILEEAKVQAFASSWWKIGIRATLGAVSQIIPTFGFVKPVGTESYAGASNTMFVWKVRLASVGDGF